MALYTTQLKSICESIVLQLNLEQKEGGGVRKVTVDDLLNDPAYEYSYMNLKNNYTPYFICELAAVQKRIFGGKIEEDYERPDGTIVKKDALYPIFDTEYRAGLQKKILLHYYTREICEETFALWKLRLISKLNDIMPYYNGLYTETFEKYLGSDYNLFNNVDMEITDNFDKKIERMVENVLNEQMKNKNNSESNSSETHGGTDTTKYNKHYTRDLGGAGYTDTIPNAKTTKTSDTPQGAVSNLTGGYMSQVVQESGDIVQRNYNSGNSKQEKYDDTANSQDQTIHGHTIHNSENNANNSSRNTMSNNNENEEAKEKSKTNRITRGKSNFQTYASILKEIRENIINVDKMVIDELEPLFMGLW